MQTSTEIHETWHGVMSWRMCVVLKTMPSSEQVLAQTSYKPKFLTRSHVVSLGTVHILCVKQHPMSLLALNLLLESP